MGNFFIYFVVLGLSITSFSTAPNRTRGTFRTFLNNGERKMAIICKVYIWGLSELNVSFYCAVIATRWLVYVIFKMSDNISVLEQGQRCRWVFTLNNFDKDVDYIEYLNCSEFHIKTAVWGYEVALRTGTEHLQGYLELNRSFRISQIRKIFNSAHWEGAHGSALKNYEYCTKSGRFGFIGDFSLEQRGLENYSNTKYTAASVPMVLSGLLDKKCASQVRVSREYAD